MIALLVANELDRDPGYVGERLQERGYELRTVLRDRGPLPATTDGIDLLVPLGSEWSVHAPNDAAIVAAEAALLLSAVTAGTPILGICYGAQILAYALGGSVERAPVPEVGWVHVETTDPELVPEGPWLEYHTDVCVPPPEVRVIASTPAAPQAFVLPDQPGVLAVQFHPEVRPALFAEWVRRWPGVAEAAGVDAADLLAETERRAPESRVAAHQLVDVYLERLP